MGLRVWITSVLRPAAVAPVPQPRTLVSLQALRFLAAFMVLLAHLNERLEDFHAEAGRTVWLIPFDGNLGVAVFFVISGFIMVHVSADGVGRPRRPVAFLRDRLTRIVPLYAVLTVVKAAAEWGLAAGGVEADPPGAFDLFRSLIFWPYLNAEGAHRPVVGPGWTLNFEMMFYVLFALSLALPRRWGLPALAIVLSALTVVGLNRAWEVGLVEPVAIWADPVVGYFIAGGLLALLREAWLSRGGLPRLAQVMLVLIGVMVAYVGLRSVAPSPAWRPLFAIGIVALAVLTQDTASRGRLRRLISAAGDTSYSLYLSQAMVLLVVGMMWGQVFDGRLLAVYYATALVGCLIGGLVCYAVIERPLIRAARLRFPSRT